jgi:peptidoglycan biosynthesis protein MviN/MurJ (putative lipid II flippase)
VPAGALGLVTRTYFAVGDLRTPVRVSSVMLAVNVLLNLLFVVGLRLDVEGLAWGTVLSAWASLALLYPGVHRRLPAAAAPVHAPSRLARQLLGAAVSALAAVGAHGAISDDPRSVAALAAAILAGLGTFALAAQLLGLPEWRRLARRLTGRSG